MLLHAKTPLPWKFRPLNTQIPKLQGKEDKFSRWVGGSDVEWGYYYFFTSVPEPMYSNY